VFETPILSKIILKVLVLNIKTHWAQDAVLSGFSEWPRRVEIPVSVANYAVLHARFVRLEVANVLTIF
jgi:hypothetical protein